MDKAKKLRSSVEKATELETSGTFEVGGRGAGRTREASDIHAKGLALTGEQNMR